MTDTPQRRLLEAQRLRTITEDLVSVAWTVDRDLRITAHDGPTQVAAGVSNDAWVGRTLEAFLEGETEACKAVVIGAHRGALRGSIERYTQEVHGRVWRVRIEPIRNAAGEVVGAAGVSLDVTAMTRLERSSALADRRLGFHLDNSPLGMIEWDADFCVSRWSRACERVFGWTPDEVIGRAWDGWGFVYEADLESVAVVVNALLSGDTPRNVSLNRNYTKDGRVIWCEWFNSIMLDDDGRLHSIVSHVQDVTEREAAKRELGTLNRELERRVVARTAELSEANARLEQEVAERREAQRLLERREREVRILTDHMPALIAYVGRDLRYRFVNSQYEAWYGRAAGELIDKTMPEVIGQRTYNEIKAHVQSVLRGDRINVQGHAYVGDDPEPRRVRSRFVPDITPAGEVIGFYSLVTDVSGFHRVEEQFRLVSAAIEQVSEFVVITDADVDAPGPRILFANRAFYETTGFEEAEVIGRSPRILQGPKTDRAVLDRLRAALRRGEPFTAETTNYRKDGDEYMVAWHIAPVRGPEGEITNWVSIQRDVTEQRRLEEAGRVRDLEMAHAARVATLGEMASGIAHEVNQPLSAIANYASGCLRRLEAGDADDVALRTALSAIERQASRSGEVIRRIRAFASRREQQRERVPVADMVESALTLLVADARRHGVRIDVQGVERCGTAWVDRIHVEQVLINLIRNAFDACEGLDEARCVVDVRGAVDGASVRIDVVDRGAGLAPSDADRMFEPFYSTKPTGMGMGLNISESLLQESGGRIEGRRNAGPGATFSIWLPRVAEHEPRRAEPEVAEASLSPGGDPA
ncbi:MAG: PAS domain S-box protein [Planctomycetota bacterium]